MDVKILVRYFIIISIFLIKYINTAIAQKIKFEHISSESGLSQGSVVSIAQDKKGFMWFGTYDGVN